MHSIVTRFKSTVLAGVERWHQPSLWLLCGSTLLILAATINRGFSALDESYYVALIVDPTRFKANLHAFGFPVHLVFLALGRSIIALRLADLLLLAGSGMLLGQALKRFARPFFSPAINPPLILLGAAFSVTEHVMWISTLGYNALLSISGCVLLAGALHWLSNDRDGDHRRDWLASAAVGLGGCFAFFAKPPSAMFAAIGVALLLLMVWRSRGFRPAAYRAIMVFFTCVPPLLLILQVTVGIGRFIEMVQVALHVLKFNNGPLDLPGRTLGELYASPAILVVSFVVFVCVLAWAQTREAEAPPAPGLRRLTQAWLVVALAFMAARILYRAATHATPFLYVGMPSVAVTFAILAYAFAQYRARAHAALVVILCVLVAVPFASAYGSANPLLVQVGMWLYGPLFAVVLAGRALLSTAIARCLELACAGYALFAVALSAHIPWGLPAPLYRQTEPLALPFARDTLLVDPVTARYATDLRRFAARGGLAADTPVMDLSGSGAGTALFLNNRAPLLPWVFPMFPNSVAMADAIWDSMSPADRRRAWIVTPIDPRFGQTRVAGYLAQHQSDYQLVGRTAMDFGYIDGGARQIIVWRPRGAAQPAQ